MNTSTSHQHSHSRAHRISNTTPFTLPTKPSPQFPGAAFLKRCLHFGHAAHDTEARTSRLPPNTPSRAHAVQGGRKRKRGTGMSQAKPETGQTTTKKGPLEGVVEKVKTWFEGIMKRGESKKGNGREKLVKRSHGATHAGGYRGRRQSGKR